MNPYKILGVPQNSDIAVCKKAYRKLSKKYHPDNAVTGDGEKFMELSKAMELIEHGEFESEPISHVVLKHDTLFKFKVA